MYPIFTRTTYGFLYSFTLIWWLTLIASLLYLRWRSGHSRWLDGTLAGLTGALIGGRLQFLWLNQPYFSENSHEIWQLFNGGLGYFGVVWGALLATAVYHLITHKSLTDFYILLTPLLPIWHLIGWLACWLDGCAYGRTAFIGWATAELPDNYGIWEVRYQTQLASLLLFAALYFIWWRTTPSQQNKPVRFWQMLIAAQLIHGTAAFWRGDQGEAWLSLPLDSALALLTTAVCLIFAFKAHNDSPPHP